MRYAGINKNDCANGEGVCVSLFVQGCPHHCKGCFNPETWSFNKGKFFSSKVQDDIIAAIQANNIIRNFSVLGGEPLCEENLSEVDKIVTKVRRCFPQIKIFIWTGYELEELLNKHDNKINHILSQINVLIDGPFIQEKKDLTLTLRGSNNQHILHQGIDF